MNLRIVRVIFAKEILDTLRDKRTLIAMIGVPVLLYPTLFLVTAQVAMVQRDRVEATASRVAVSGDGADSLREWFALEDTFALVDAESPQEALADGDIDAFIQSDSDLGESATTDTTAEIRVEYDATESASRLASDRVGKAIREHGEAILAERLSRSGLAETFAEPIKIDYDNIATASKRTGFFLGTILPMMMVVMLGVGAFYPAVDLTAGEKERGTFETLLSTPASKLEILAGKFLTVFVLAIFTGLLNLASMGATMMFYIGQLTAVADEAAGPFNAVAFELPASSFLLIGLILFPLALFIAATMMAVAVTARSFREAQNYVTPFFVLILVPAAMASIPDVELTDATQFVPILNVSLLFRDLMMGNAALNTAFAVVLCTVIYALAAIAVAVSMFQREEVILSEDRGMPFSLNRAHFARRDVPTPGFALGLFAFVMLLLFYAGAPIQAREPFAGIVVTEYLLILVPVVGVLFYARVNVREALNLRAAPALGWLGVPFLSLGWVVISLQIGLWNEHVVPAPPEFETFALDLVGRMETLEGVLTVLFIAAVSPAICEEVLFRGPLLSGLRDRLPTFATIVIVGILFGLFHISIHRIIPTAMTGMVLTYLGLRTRSILPCMLMHGLFNGVLLLSQANVLPESVRRYLEDIGSESAGVPVELMAGGVILFAVGVGCVELSARGNTTQQ